MDINSIGKSILDSAISNWEGDLVKLATGVLGGWIFGRYVKMSGKNPSEISKLEMWKAGAMFCLFILLALGALSNGQVQNGNIGFKASVLQAAPIKWNNTVITNMADLPKNVVTSIGSQAAGSVDYSNGYDFRIMARIVNLGESSGAWNWRAYIILPNHKERTEVPLPSYAFLTASGGAELGPPATTPFGMIPFRTDNNLVQLLVTSDLPRGRAAIGWIGIHVNGALKPLWGTHFIVTFEDAFGHVSQLEDIWEPEQTTEPK